MKPAIVLLCAAAALAGPVDRSKTCSRHCTDSRKFSYQPGTTYLYNYASTTETSMQGTTAQKVAVHMACQVEIEPLGSCDFLVQIRGTRLEEEDPSRPGHRRPSPNQDELREALERYPLRFSYQDGRVDNLCPAEGETPRALNVKKAILSMLQNSMKELEVNEDVDELDIAGRCPTFYETLPTGWSSTSVRRVKDLTQCKERESAVTALQASAVEGQNLRSAPVVKGSQECKQVFQNGLVDSVECKEWHMVRPFSKHENGARTDVTQRLNLRNQRRAQGRRAAYNAGIETDLLFDHDYDVEDSTSSLERAENALRAVAESAGDVVKSSSPGLFTELVFSLRKLSVADLQTMFRRAQSMSPKAKKFFVDSLPAVGSPAAIRMMADSMISGEVSGVEADIWLTSLAFVSKPTIEMIEYTLPLLRLERSQAYLGVSTMAYAYCRDNANCGSMRPIKELVRALYLSLGENCYARDRTTTLMVLKALGNLGQSEGAEDTLYRCFENPQLDIEIRLAAVQAFRRFDCDIPRNKMLRIYQNVHENVELRIASYLAAIRCPSSPVIEAVKDTLRVESIKQVGSFVYSHIRNLAREPSAYQREYRAIANDLAMKNRFELDFRKFSRNVHYRMFFDPLDTGFELDGDLIYTPDSYYPRSARVSTSFDIFGKKVDLFEAGARAEHMDKIIEKLAPGDENAIRSKRAIGDNKIDELDRRFAIKSKYSGEPKASAYIKFFGNEIASLQLAGGTANPYNDLMNFMSRLSDPKGLDLTKSILFADTTLTVPTSNGFPLRVSLNGSATVALKVGGNSQFRKGSVDVTGLIKPSGAVQLAMLMSVDAHKSTSGVRMVATMSSSWSVDGSLQLQQGQAIKAKLNMPEKEMELIDVKSKIFLVNGASEMEHQNEPEKKMEAESCTGPAFDSALGVKLCGRAEFPVAVQKYGAPMYPFSGNAELSLRLVKTDPTLTSYNFESSWTNTKDLVAAVLSVNTPGTTTDREITASLQHNLRDGTIALRLKTPPKKLSIEGQYNFDEKLKKLNLQAKADDEAVLKLITELKADASSSDNSVSKYTHLTEVAYRGRRMLLVNGQWAAAKGRKYSGSVNIEELTEKPVSLKMDLDMTDKRRVRYEGSVRSFFVEGAMSGYTQTGDNWSTKADGEFSLMSGRVEKLGFTAKFRDLSSGSLTKYNGAASFQNTLHPALNTDLQWDCQKTDGQLENSIQIVRGEGGKKSGNVIKIQQIARYTGTLANNNAGLSLKLKYPQKRLDWQLEMKHENTPESLVNRMDLTYSPGRQINTVIDVSLAPDAKADIKLNYPGREMRMAGNYRSSSADEYRGDLVLQWNKDKKIEASGTLKPGYDRRQYNPSFEAEIRIPNKRPVTVSGSLRASRGYYAISAASQCSRGKYELSGSYRSPRDYNHNLDIKVNTPQDTYSGTGDLKTSSGKIGATVSLKLGRYRDVLASTELSASREGKALKFDCKWDAARDASRRASINAEVRRVPGGYNANFAVKCPKQDIRGTVSTTIGGSIGSNAPLRVSSRGELEWVPRKKITYSTNLDWNPDYRRRSLKADAQITTPFQMLDAFGVALTHNDDGREWNSEAKMTLPRRRVFVLSTDGLFQSDRARRTAQGTVRIQTPYSRQYILEAVHGATYYDTNNKISLRWDENKVISAEASGSYGRGMLKAKAEVLTPIRGYDRLTASLDHIHTPESVKSQALVQWNSYRRITLDVDGQVNRNNAKAGLDGKLRLTTPFRGAELFTSQLSFSNDVRNTIADIEVARNQDKIGAGLKMSLMKSRYDVAREINIHLKTPVYGYENIDATGSYSADMEKFNAFIGASLPYGKQASIRSEGKIGSISNFSALLHIHLPVRNYEHINLDISHAATSRNAKSTGHLTAGPSKFTVEANVDYVFTRATHDITGKMLITTPIRDYQQISIDLKNKRVGLTYDTTLQCTSARTVVNMKHHLMIRNIANFEHSLEIISPFPILPMLNVKNKNQMQSGIAYHSTEIEWQNRRRLALTMNASAKQSPYANEMQAGIELSTPWRTLSIARLNADYNSNNQQSTTKISTEWNHNKFFIIEGALKNRGFLVADGKLALSSSIKSLQAITMNAKYDIATQQKSADVSFQWDPRPDSIVTLRASGSRKPRGADIDLSLTTPFRNYERIQLQGNVLSDETALQGLVSVSTQLEKYELTGNVVNTGSGSTVELALTTPIPGIRKQRFYGEYTLYPSKIISKLSAEWEGKLITAESELLKTETEVKASLSFNTPFQTARNVHVVLGGSSINGVKSISGGVQVDRQKMEMNGLLDLARKSVKLEIRSPVESMQTIEIEGNIQESRQSKEGNLLLRWSPDGIIVLKTKAAAAPLSYEVVLTTPFRGYRKLSLSSDLDLTRESKRANIAAEKDGERISLAATGMRTRRESTINIDLSTPFKGLEFLKISGSLKADSINDMKGSLGLKSPIYLLENVEFLTEYQNLDQLGRLFVSAKADSWKHEMSAKRVNANNAVVEANLLSEYSPVGEPKSSLKININSEGLEMISGDFLLSQSGRDHSFSVNLKNRGPYEGSIRINCPNLPGNTAAIGYMVNTPSTHYAIFKVTGEYALQTHVVEGSFENKFTDIKTELKLNCPLLKQGIAVARLRLSRSPNAAKALLSVGFEPDMHTINIESNWDRSMVKGKMDVESSYVPGRFLKAEGAITTNRQGGDLLLSIENLQNTHRLSGNWKELPGILDAQVMVDTSLLSEQTMKGSFNYRSDHRSGRLESSLIFSTQRKSLSCFVALSARDLHSMEGNIKIETPFESLRFAHVDASFNNVQNKAIEWSFAVKSSAPWLREASVSGKMRRKDGSVEATLQGRLPVRTLSNFEANFMCTHNTELSVISPKLTVVVPGGSYASETDIRLYAGDYSVSASHEWGPRQKVAATLAVKKPNGSFSVQATIATPFRNMEHFEAGMACGREGGKRTFRATYKNARNQIYELRHANSYHGPLNFLFESTLVTTVAGLSSAGVRILQQSSRSRLVTNLECNLEAKNVVFNLDHDRRDIKGALMLTTSVPKLRALRATYELSRYKVGGDVNVNDMNVLKVEGGAQYLKDFRAHKCDLAVNVPALRVAVEGHYIPANSGNQLIGKFQSAKRSIELQTMWKNQASNLAHQLSLKWGQDRSEKFSYDMKVTRSVRRDLSNTDISCEVNFPLRSFELRASQSQRKNINSLSCELFWDAARDRSKHATIMMEHQNLSTRSAWAHKMLAFLKHPKLNKDITMRLEGSLSSDEVHGKTELEYSADSRHNVMLEGRLKNHGRSHVSAELTARQPVSLMDIRTVAELRNTRDEASAHVTVNYMNRNRQMRVQELKASILKLRRAIDVLLQSGRDRNQLKGEMYNRGQEIGMSLQHQFNELPPTKTHLRINKRHSNMEIGFTGSDASSAKMSATASMDKHEIRLSHTTLGRSVSDILIKLGLREKRFLSSEISWRPELGKEASDYALDKYGSMRSQLHDIWQSFSTETQQELRAKRFMMGRSLSQEIRPLLDDLSKDWRALDVELTRAVAALKELYRQDQFYVKTVVSACSGLITAVGQVLADAGRVVLAVTDYVARYSSVFVECACEKIADIVERCAQTSRQTLIFIERLLVVAINRVSLALADIAEVLMTKLEALFHRIAEGVVSFCERYGPSTAGARAMLNRIMETVSSYTTPIVERIQKNAFFQGMWRYVERILATLNKFNVESVTRGYRYAYETVSNAVGDVYENVVFHPHVQYISDVTQNAIRKVRDVSDKLGLHDISTAIIDMAAKQIQESIVEGFTDAVREYSNLRSGLRYEFSPQRGVISAEIRLPAQKDSLVQALDLTSYPEFDRLVAIRDPSYDVGFNWQSMWDTYYQYSRLADTRIWLPPFKARALMAGSQHYRTFDGFHFEFAGECSYLLAKDFLNDNFAVVINYARDGQRVTKKSITVYSDGTRFDISNDYKITKAGSKIELPAQVGGTTLRREGHVIVVENTSGLKISCNLAYDQCVTEVTGDYFGKTGGLLGTYDYEDQLDLMTPDRKVTGDASAFASEWEVGQGRCRSQRNLAEPAATDPRATSLCSKYFEKEESPLRSCFKMVDPKSYLDMCLRDMRSASYDEMEEKICVTAAAYREECREFGVPLDMPRTCVRCEKPNGSEMLAGDIATVTDQDSPASAADVIFVVERKICNKNVIPNLIRIAQSIEERYAARGFVDTRYAVVGFGGDGVAEKPHVVTADGQIFSSIRALVSAFGSLSIGNGESDPFAALVYAGQLPVRMASMQNMILVKCTTCKPDDDNSMYADIYRMLIDRGIHLHILDDDDFNVRTASKPSKSKRIFGVDRRLAFTVKDLKDLQGDPEIHSQIRLPKDFCVPLALESNGTLFSSMKMFEKRAVNKKFVDVMARRVALSSAPECQICECVSLEDGVGQSVCSRCVSPTLGPVRSPDFSPAMYEETAERKTYKRPKTKTLRTQKKQ